MGNTPLEAIRRLTRAWIQKDEKQMSRWLTDDVVEIGPAFSPALRGKKEFFRKYRAYLTGPSRVASYRILTPRTIRLSSELALVYFHYRMRTADNGRTEESQGKEGILVQRIGRGWKVRFLHWHRDETR